MNNIVGGSVETLLICHLSVNGYKFDLSKLETKLTFCKLYKEKNHNSNSDAS